MGCEHVAQIFVSGVETFFGVGGSASLLESGDDVAGQAGIVVKNLAQLVEVKKFLKVELQSRHVVGFLSGAEIVPMHFGPGIGVGPG